MSTHKQNPQRTAREADASEPERMITPEEEAGMDLAQLEDPPQAEGSRGPEDEQGDWKDRRRNEGAD